MELQGAENIYIKGVTEEQINDAFKEAGKHGEFIILSKAPKEFIQAAGEGETPYQLEYRDISGQFRSANPVNRIDVCEAFKSYLKDDNKWKTNFQWKLNETKPWWKLW